MAVVQSIANRKWAAGLFAVAMFWLGLLIGVAFLATPAKFLAPSLSLPVALDVGRHTFYVFNKVEWVLVAVLLLMLLSGGSIWLRILGIIAGLLVIAETVWMLPLLDQRVSLIIAGKTAPPANLHSLYIVMEFVKLFALVVIAFGAARSSCAFRPIRPREPDRRSIAASSSAQQNRLRYRLRGRSRSPVL